MRGGGRVRGRGWMTDILPPWKIWAVISFMTNDPVRSGAGEEVWTADGLTAQIIAANIMESAVFCRTRLDLPRRKRSESKFVLICWARGAGSCSGRTKPAVSGGESAVLRPALEKMNLLRWGGKRSRFMNPVWSFSQTVEAFVHINPLDNFHDPFTSGSDGL